MEMQQTEETKKCPYCAEEILASARKCRHCGEWLDKSETQSVVDKPEKKNFGKIGCLIFLVIVIIIMIASSFSGSDKSQNSSSSNPEATVNSKSKQETLKQPAEPKEWVSVIKQQSVEEKQSNTFVLQGGKQKIVYSLTGSMSVCSVYIVKEGESLDKEGGFPEVMITEAKSGETMARKSAGQYYLDVKPANGTCTVEVFEER